MRSAEGTRGLDSFLILLALGVTGTVVLSNGCVGTPGTELGGAPAPVSSPWPKPAGYNVMKVTVNGTLCGNPANQYANEPCVSVTICAPGSATDCQTIDNILLDTGSFGLRLYSSVVTVPLTPVTVAGGDLAECVQFGDNSSEWGQIMTADVRLAAEPPAQVPIMLINSRYAHPPGPCTSAQSRPDTGPAQTGFNGILGVGLFATDCGSTCVSDPGNGEYYACKGATCSPSAALPEEQVQNPVAMIPDDFDGQAGDNNGVILRLPTVGATGATSLDGTLVLGIGTQDNNLLGGATVFSSDENANFTAVLPAYNATAISSFIDSGSSVLFFPPPADATLLPDCNSVTGGAHGAAYAGFYCPASTQNFSATNQGYNSSTTGNILFEVDNAFDLFSTSNRVFSTMADSSSVGANAVLDWGLPFFFGRDVYVGIEGRRTTAGAKTYSGPYWAY